MKASADDRLAFIALMESVTRPWPRCSGLGSAGRVLVPTSEPRLGSLERATATECSSGPGQGRVSLSLAPFPRAYGRLCPSPRPLGRTAERAPTTIGLLLRSEHSVGHPSGVADECFGLR